MSTARDDADAPFARARRRTFARAYAVAAVPLGLLFLPLLAHRSDDPEILGFSRDYVTFLALTAVGIALLSLLVAAVCARARTVLPAYSFLVSLLALVGTCLVVETVLTYRLRLEDAFAQYSAWGHKRSLLFAFEATPNHTWTNVGATYTTDRLGFRTHLADGSVEAGTGRTRIFTLGESSVFGYGLNDDETWPHLLESKLRRKLDDPSLLVVNAGNNGHTSLQTLLRFYTKVLPLRPSHVILYLGPNDVYGTGPDRLLISEEILFSGSVAQYWNSKTRGLNPYARSLLFYVVQQRVPALGNIMRGREEAESSDTAAQAAANWNGAREKEIIGGNYLENVRTLCLISQAHGITPIIVTFAHDKNDWAGSVIDANNALLRELAAEKGIASIDVAATFESIVDKNKYFFEDRYHPNRRGAELIASTLAEGWAQTPLGGAATSLRAEPRSD